MINEFRIYFWIGLLALGAAGGVVLLAALNLGLIAAAQHAIIGCLSLPMLLMYSFVLYLLDTLIRFLRGSPLDILVMGYVVMILVYLGVPVLLEVKMPGWAWAARILGVGALWWIPLGLLIAVRWMMESRPQQR